MILRNINSGRLIMAIMAIFFSLLAAAQQDESWSVYGHAGGVFRFPNQFGPELNLMLQQDDQFPQVASVFGVGAWKTIRERTKVGVDLFSTQYPKVQGTNATVNLWGIGGSGRIGYDLLQFQSFAFMPYIGLGINSSNARLTNHGYLINRSPIYIPPGQSQRITGQLAFIDVGGQLLKISEQSFTAGLSAGYQQRVFGTDWKAEWGDSATFLTHTTHSMVYLRLLIMFNRS